MSAPTTTTPAAAAPASTPSTATKVFVGNLSFKTNESDLAGQFSAAGRVVSANIIHRGPRSLGYGFVEMETEEEASKAVSIMNKRDIDGREINVELAKPRDDTNASPSSTGAPSAGEGAKRGRGGGGLRRGGPRGGGRGGRGGRGGGFISGPGPRKRTFRPRTEEGEVAPAPSRGGGRGGAPRGRRPPRSPSTNANRTQSKTTLFVANLPFRVEDNDLQDMFKEFNVSKAHVVKKRNGRSKGFGFVEFNSETDQQKALASLDKKVVEGRELIVKIALTENREDFAESESTKTESAPLEKKEEKKAEDAKE